jgi:hypothetical protein
MDGKTHNASSNQNKTSRFSNKIFAARRVAVGRDETAGITHFFFSHIP